MRLAHDNTVYILYRDEELIGAFRSMWQIQEYMKYYGGNYTVKETTLFSEEE